jgi:succinoglycan biosynthesis transport protein ExoP
MTGPLFFDSMDPLKVSPPQETKLHFLDYWRIIRIRKTVILAVFLLVVITATVVTFILPESFVSSARIRVERDVMDITPIASPQFALGSYDPYFIQTEFEVIQSQVILGKVVEDLHLNERWGTKFAGGQRLKTTEAIDLLKRLIDLRPVRNTSLIEIRVYSDKPEEATELANAVAEAYRAHRLEQSADLMKNGITALKEQLDEQQKTLKQAQVKVDQLRTELKISDSDPMSTAPTPALSADTVRALQGQVISLEAEEARLRTQLKKLRELDPKQLRGTIQTAVEPDSQLATFLNELDLSEQRVLMMQKDYRPDHPLYQSGKQMVDDLNRKIDERVSNIITGLETRLDSTRAFENQLKTNLLEAKQKDIKNAEESRPYYEAKQQLAELLQFRTILWMKIASQQTDLSLPKSSMVEIVDRATPNMSPVRPNKPLNIILGVVIGLVVGVGLAFFIEYLDTSVKTIDDVERTLQAPVLGVIPQNVGFLLDEGAESPHAEAYRVLRTNLLFSRKEDKLNTVAVVSAGAGEGKSTTVFNLASVFAQNGSRVVMVDSDLRRPTLHKMLRVTNNFGLTNYLLKQNTLEEVIQTTSLPTLDFMASGKLPSSSLGILSSVQMRDLIAELKQRYDFVFFDSPPIMGVSDASILASEVDMTLQVIQYRRYPQPLNVRAKQMIEKVGGNLVGIVLNNINVSQDENYYYYGGYYHEYYAKSEEAAGSAAPAGAEAGAKAGDKTKPDIDSKS